MPPSTKSSTRNTPTGVYNVNEDGLEYQHLGEETIPKDGDEYLERFRESFELNVLENKGNELVFEMIGCDTSFANALRRILLAEVPTMAIETVYIENNTSIIHDEVLAHRMGLIPLNVDARLFNPIEEGDDANDLNTLVFRLEVTCPSKPPGKQKVDPDGDATSNFTETEKSVLENPELDEAAFLAARKQAIETAGRPFTLHVYSKDLDWIVQGSQESRFPEGVRPVHEDILIAKLRPGQEISLEAHATRGIGRDHAKFSPVATASYRLYTNVELTEPVYDQDAEDLVHLYEPGVFELVPASRAGNRVEAKVCNPYACTMSRNYMRNPTLARAVKMTRIPNHFIFSVESVGMHKPAVLVAEALKVLQEKCTSLMALAEEQTDTF